MTAAKGETAFNQHQESSTPLKFGAPDYAFVRFMAESFYDALQSENNA